MKTGHQVRGELDARRFPIKGAREGADQERLADARHPFQQRVPTGDQTGQNVVDDRFLADHHAGDLLLDLLRPLPSRGTLL